MIRLGFGGDVVIGRGHEPYGPENRARLDPGVSRFIAAQDGFVANLETPLTKATLPNMSHYSKLVDSAKGKRVYFRAEPDRGVDVLHELKVSVATLANNHILDYGIEGLHSTLQVLRRRGILPVGAGMTLAGARAHRIRRFGGMNVAFLAASYTYEATRRRPGASPIRTNSIVRGVREASSQADFVVASLHLGDEFTTYPRDNVRILCRRLIDAGADVVACSHPDLLQPVESYQHGIIAYSLGNYYWTDHAYGSPLSQDIGNLTRLSAVLSFRIDEASHRIEGIEVLPIEVTPGFTKVAGEGNRAIIRDLLRGRVDARLEPPSAPAFKHFLRLMVESARRGEFVNWYLLARRAIEYAQSSAAPPPEPIRPPDWVEVIP